MTLVFDAQMVPLPRRHEALNELFGKTELPQSVHSEACAVANAPHRTELAELGPGVQLIRNRSAGLSVTRTEAHVKIGAPERFCLGWGDVRMLVESPAGQHVVEPGTLHLVDGTGPYLGRHTGLAWRESLVVDGEQLGLPVDVVRSALVSLQRSPLHEMVWKHCQGLFDTASLLPPAPRELLARATVQLVRALITTAADDGRQRAALGDSLRARVVGYIEAHLGELSLSPERIAAAHNISVRHLYNVWAGGGAGTQPSLRSWIMKQRLELARERLRSPDAGQLTIAAVSRACGFADATHFSRRFLNEYGMSPRDWRACNQPRRSSLDG